MFDIEVVNDNINEVEQLFVVFLRVVDAVNPARIDLTGRFATLGRIIDDDRKCGSAWGYCSLFLERRACS